MKLDPRRNSPFTHTSIPSRETPGVFAKLITVNLFHDCSIYPGQEYLKADEGIRHSGASIDQHCNVTDLLAIYRPPRHSSFKLEVQKQLRHDDSRMKIGFLQRRASQPGFFWHLRQQVRTKDIPNLPLGDSMGFEPAKIPLTGLHVDSSKRTPPTPFLHSIG